MDYKFNAIYDDMQICIMNNRGETDCATDAIGTWLNLNTEFSAEIWVVMSEI